MSSIESFDLLYKTPRVDDTYEFYVSSFDNLEKDKSPSSFLRISFGDSEKCDLVWRGYFSEDLDIDPDGRMIHIGPIESQEEKILALPAQVVVVLRTKRIMETLAFYEYKQGSSWTQERHGNGPIHYSSHWGKNVVEIYPQRKSSTSTVELVTPSITEGESK